MTTDTYTLSLKLTYNEMVNLRKKLDYYIDNFDKATGDEASIFVETLRYELLYMTEVES